MSSDESNEPDDERVVDELARVFHDSNEAMMLVRRAGFPAGRVPSFNTPLVFWSHVIEAARNGATRGGAWAIMEAAARIYPANEVLAKYGAPPEPGHARRISRAVRRIVEALRISTKREVVFVVDGLGHPSQSSLVDELLASSELPVPGAALVLAAPPVTTPSTRLRAQTFTRLDDLPVIDVHEPTELGPGVAFLRELLERRLARAHQARPPIQEDVLSRLCWASGGRPGECLHLVRRLALAALDAPPERLSDLTTQVLHEHRSRLMIGVTAEHHALLGSLLRTAVTDVPDDPTARELHALGILRLYPTPEGRHRALPHPLLVEGLVQGSVDESRMRF